MLTSEDLQHPYWYKSCLLAAASTHIPKEAYRTRFSTCASFLWNEDREKGRKSSSIVPFRRNLASASSRLFWCSRDSRSLLIRLLFQLLRCAAALWFGLLRNQKPGKIKIREIQNQRYLDANFKSAKKIFREMLCQLEFLYKKSLKKSTWIRSPP